MEFGEAKLLTNSNNFSIPKDMTLGFKMVVLGLKQPTPCKNGWEIKDMIQFTLMDLGAKWLSMLCRESCMIKEQKFIFLLMAILELCLWEHSNSTWMTKDIGNQTGQKTAHGVVLQRLDYKDFWMLKIFKSEEILCLFYKHNFRYLRKFNEIY